MTKIMLSDFTDVVSKAGSPKATKIAQIKYRPDYNPMTDFYKPLREAIVKVHENDGQKKDLKKIVENITDQKKQSNYPEAVAGYLKWWGNKKIEWFDPLRTTYSHQGFEIVINPELAMLINGVPHVIKLYLKGEKLIKLRADIISGLMELTLKKPSPNGTKIGILDVRNAKLFTFTGNLDHLHAMVDGELAYIESMWGRV